MLTIFNGSDGYPISQDDYYIRELASGYDEVIFNVNIRDEIYKYIKEEAIVRDRNQNTYLIKQIDAGEKTAKVIAQIDLDDWRSELHFNYSNNSATVVQTVTDVLPTGWTVIDQSRVTKRRTIPTSDTTTDYNVTGLKVLEDCASVYDVRFRFDTALKRVYIINPFNYESRGAFATRDLNLRALNYKGKSEGFITRLYAEGADGLTFASINDGKDYVENKTYANKVVCGFWKDDRYTDKQSLLDDAITKLSALAKPTQSYDCDVLDLANTNPDMYGFEDFSLFEVITLIDDAKETRTEYQVVERWTYPYYPASNKIILSLSTPNIQSAIQTVFSSLTQSTSGFQQIIQSAIANATAMITGNNGGYLVLHDSNNDGTPDELLIMNTNSIATATKIWRWNQQGLGYSNNGYNGPYGLAINMDGSIIGDYIAANSIDGGSIRAGTIDANALSVEAKEELAAIHSYLSRNIFTDISLWEYGVVPPYYETIDGKTYLVLDGTGISEYNINYYAYTPTDVRGNIDFKVTFTYHIDREITLAQSQRFPFVHYTALDGLVHDTWFTLGAQTIPANTDFTWSNKRFSASDVDSTRGVYLGFYYIPGCKTYIESITAESTVDAYAEAGMDFNAYGLSVVASSIEDVTYHDYLPYDAMTNVARWNFAGTHGYSLTSESVTIAGKTVQALVFDGTSSESGYTYQEGYCETDVIGTAPITVKFKYAFASDYTPSSNKWFTHLSLYNGSSWTNYFVCIFTGGRTYTANTEYSYEVTSTPAQAADYFAKRTKFIIPAYEGVKIYVYDLEITSTAETYKKASLSYTADGLDSVVQAGSVISSINQSAEQISIKAEKVDLTGDLDLHGEFTTDTSPDPNLQGYYCKLISSSLVFYDDNDRSLMSLEPTYVNSQPVVGVFLTDWSGGQGVSTSITSKGSYLRDTTIYGNLTMEKTVSSDKVLFQGILQCNDGARFYGNVYNSGGGVQFVSDRRKKKNIKDLAIEKARSFIMSLKPRKYKFKKSISTSNRYHHGFIAQEVKEAMPEDWGLYCENEEMDFIGLRYDEIIADLVAVVQDQQKRIEALEKGEKQ